MARGTECVGSTNSPRPAFLDAKSVAPLGAVATRYAIALPPALAALIDKSDPNDPIAKQFVPDAREGESVEGDDPDPIGDNLKSPVKGLVHRYPDRVLIKPIAACAVYCRFCFRREMVGPGGEAMSETDWAAALAYVAARPEIWEVILTGGDPLFQSERRLAETTKRLAAIAHVKVLRWHTRLARRGAGAGECGHGEGADRGPRQDGRRRRPRQPSRAN